MPKPFRLQTARSLPPSPEIVEHDGRHHVRIKERGRSVLYPLSKDGKKYLRPSKRWYFKYRDASGTVRRVKGTTDLKATEQMASEMERRVARARAGLVDPSDEHLRRPLTDHLRDYTTTMKAKGNTTAHINNTVGCISALLDGCGFVFPTDVDLAKVSDWLHQLRRGANPVLIPAGDSFRVAEVATLFGVTVGAIGLQVKRNGLTATGNGKARRLPRATVEALAISKAKGASPETVNHYICAMKGFFRWLVRAKRIGSDPLESLALVNTAADVRRIRRELTADELGRLFTAARDSTRTYRGLTGSDRYFLYLTAAATGFRASALANLTPADFDLGADMPVVTLAARFAKNRKTKVQPLPSDVTVALREYLDGKPKNAPMWGGSWATGRRGADMIRIDLDAAGIPYAVEGSNGPEYADFHALRHSYLTMLGRHGVDLRTAQELAGHSTPILTARYSHRRLYDLSGAVNKLPDLVPSATEATVPLRLTGTDGASSAVPNAVPTGGIRQHQSALQYTSGVSSPVDNESPQPHEAQQTGTSRHQSASDRTRVSEGTRTPDVQNHNLDDCRCKMNRNNGLTSDDPSCCTAGRTSRESEGDVIDADLSRIAAAWPMLPDAIKRGIMAMIATVGTEKGENG